jgi:hypothetical protein
MPVELRRKSKLAQVARADRALGGRLAASERWQQHCRENRDDGDDNEQFDKRECLWSRIEGRGSRAKSSARR